MSFTITQTQTIADLFLYPGSDDIVAFIPHGEVGNYLCVDDIEQDADDDDTYVSTNSATDVTDIYRPTGHADESGLINYVLIVARTKSYLYTQGPTSTFKIAYLTGAATNLGANHQLTNGYQDIELLLINPPGGGPWTWELINALKIGFTGHSQGIIVYPQYFIRPTSDTHTHPDNVPSSGSDIYAMIDEEIADEDETHVQMENDDFRCGCSDPANNGETIDYLTLYARGRYTGDKSGNFRTLIYLSGVQKNEGGSSHTLGSTYQTFSGIYTTNPSNGAWSWDDINALQIGITSNNGASSYNRFTQLYGIVSTHTSIYPEIRVTQIYAQVNYNPGSKYVTLNSPRSLDYDNERSIETVTFDDGSKRNDDYGSAGKTLRLSGMEPSGSQAAMLSLERLRNAHAEVDITGLPSSSMNGTWCIKSFNYRDEGDKDEVFYVWDLGLATI